MKLQHALLLLSAFCFGFTSSPIYANQHVLSEESSIEQKNTGIERDYNEDGSLRGFRFYNSSHQLIEEYEVEEGKVYQVTALGKIYIGWFEPSESVTESVDLYYTEPNWGPLLSVSTRVGAANGFGNTGTAIAALLCAALPAGVGITATALVWLGNEIAASNSSYTTVTTYFREAAGCPQYRWYNRVDYFNSSGAKIASTNLNSKSFIGVRNSPENPPACREYGF